VRRTLRSEGVGGLVADLPAPMRAVAQKVLDRIPHDSQDLTDVAGAQGGRAASAVGGILSATWGALIQMVMMLIAFFFLLGTFLEPVPALIIVVPIMGPLIAHLGYDPVHFGIITIMLLVVGSVTPPVGVLAMVASRIAGINYSASLAMLAPFIAAWMAVILLVAYVPDLVLWLPRLMK